MKRRRIFPPRAALSVLCIVLVLTVLLNLFQSDRVQALEAQLTAVYQKAFIETQTLMDGIGTGLEKLLVSGSDRQRALLLTDVALSADRASRSLSALPDAQGERAAVLAFLSSLTERAKALAAKKAAAAEEAAKLAAEQAAEEAEAAATEGVAEEAPETKIAQEEA